MFSRIDPHMQAARRRLTACGTRMRTHLARCVRAWRYARERLSADDAQTMILDCEAPAGWHALLTLADADVLEQLRERFTDHPALAHLTADACARVAHKWQDHSDALHYAQCWAMELIEGYAIDLDLNLVTLTPAVPDDGEAAPL